MQEARTMYSPFIRMLTCFSVSLLVVILQGADAASFGATGSSPVYANRTGNAVLKWQYILSGGEVQQRIDCGYVPPGQTQQTIWVTKEGQQVATARVSGVTVIDEGNTIGMTVANPQAHSGKRFYCSLIYTTNNAVQAPITSNVLVLSILDRPKFISCLTEPFTVMEGYSLNVSCSVYGNPVPRLTCRILRHDGSLIQQLGDEYKNISYIAITNVQQTYGKVVCDADGRLAGTAQLTKNIIVNHVPSGPINFRRTASTSSSITVAWGPPSDSGGFPILNYVIHYGLDLNNLQVVNISANIGDFTIENLESSRDYVLQIRARSQLGLGVKSEITEKTILYQGPDPRKGSDNSKTIAIVVPIVVVLVLIIVVGVGCYLKRRKSTPKNLPVSYIEEAVGYPPSGKGLYASVEKSGQKPAEDGESTSGYPDILHQTKERPTEPNMNEVEYAPEEATSPYTPLTAKNGEAGRYDQEDEEMSPSYENSRKEYV